MMSAFWISLFFVFAAEMGDKTQLVALAFATRFKTSVVLAGVFIATILVHLVSVCIGEAASIAIPVFWIKVTAGLAFVFFGLGRFGVTRSMKTKKVPLRCSGRF